MRAIGLYLWHCKRNAITESTVNRTEMLTKHRAPYVVYTTTHVLPSDLVASALERQQVSFSECWTGLIELVIFQRNRPVFCNTRISKEKEKNRENGLGLGTTFHMPPLSPLPIYFPAKFLPANVVHNCYKCSLSPYSEFQIK